MSKAANRTMETLQQALGRLEKAGFTASLRALPGGRLGARTETEEGEVSLEADRMQVEEVVRFEGASDPEDQAVLFALSSPDGQLKGCFVATYGPQVDARTAAVIERLDADPQGRSSHPLPEAARDGAGGSSEPADRDPNALVASWLQDVLSAEHFVRKTSEQLMSSAVVAEDAQASLLVRLVHDRASRHAADIEVLLEDRDASPSGLRRAVASGLGVTLGWMERLPRRDLVQVVRDFYAALNYAAAGYHVLYTRAALLERGPEAKLALGHLREYTPVVRQLSQLLAWAGALDVHPDRWEGHPRMSRVVDDLVESWSREVTGS